MGINGIGTAGYLLTGYTAGKMERSAEPGTVGFVETVEEKAAQGKAAGQDEKAFEMVGRGAPQEVKDAWMDAAKEVNANGMGIRGNGMMSHISQMMDQRIGTVALDAEVGRKGVVGDLQVVEIDHQPAEVALYRIAVGLQQFVVEPIRYALGDASRLPSGERPLSLSDYAQLTFETPDPVKFPCLTLAPRALTEGGNTACIINAANEVAVAAFLRDEISFHGIYDTITDALCDIPFIASPSLDDYVATHHATIDYARRKCHRHVKSLELKV